jgi:hypothetical protein
MTKLEKLLCIWLKAVREGDDNTIENARYLFIEEYLK